ncbi:MAG: CBS domain-containing protein, partial [Solirubrobacterales bacterium]|nr:CBS domain-containing protein [Solirubrobacterales bacterium]
MPPTAIQPFHGSYLMPAFEHATVADAMHPGILSCQADASLTDVARMMAANHVHCVAVMTTTHEDGGAAIVWGIISDLDLLRAGVVGGRNDCAGSLARQPVISVSPSLPLRQAG